MSRGALAISPAGMTVTDWFDAVMMETETPWAFGKLLDPSKWQDHAVNFLRASPYNGRTMPNPYQFTDWREWAVRAFPMLEPR